MPQAAAPPPRGQPLPAQHPPPAASSILTLCSPLPVPLSPGCLGQVHPLLPETAFAARWLAPGGLPASQRRPRSIWDPFTSPWPALRSSKHSLTHRPGRSCTCHVVTAHPSRGSERDKVPAPSVKGIVHEAQSRTSRRFVSTFTKEAAGETASLR